MPRSRGNGGVVGKVITPGTSGAVSAQEATQYVLSGQWPGSTYAATSSSSGPTITSIIVTDSGYNTLETQEVYTQNNFIKIIGTGFESTSNVYLSGTMIPRANVTFYSSTELRISVPNLSTGNNFLYVFNSQNLGTVYSNTINVLRSPNVSVDYLYVAGGGSGGSGWQSLDNGGGGGAGGVLMGSTILRTETTYTITIGSGGSNDTNGANTSVTNSSNTHPYSIIAIGGGCGGGQASRGGSNGGSGGGAGPGPNSQGIGSGVAGQGYSGGAHRASSPYNGGGGGGAAQPGNTVGYNGGNGIQSSISGTATYYGGGGSGGADNSAADAGLGGGAVGATAYTDPLRSGGVNTGGGGGGGASQNQSIPGGSGGSGVVIIRISDDSATTTTTGSPTINVMNGYRIFKFTSSGTITF